MHLSLLLLGALLMAPSTTKKQWLDDIARARVWEETDVSAKDLYQGPAGRLPFAVDDEVVCDFVPKPMSGWTPKFTCRLEDGTTVKVKYDDGGRYKEVYGEVLGTRLFWALGFYADRMLPVHVTCRGCPESPWAFVDARKKRPLDAHGDIASFPEEARLGDHRFELATIEEPIDAQTIQRKHKKGWKWKLLRDVDAARGGATIAEIDAFKLLNAFVQNADNKAIQNRLACPEPDCRTPIMYVNDLGSVFGRGGFTTGGTGRVDYEGWKSRPVWRDEKSCRARLTSVGGIFRTSTLKDPVIGEPGRALLAAQLGELSDSQIGDLFRAARVEALDQKFDDGEGGTRTVTIEDWVALFKAKRSEITDHPVCAPR